MHLGNINFIFTSLTGTNQIASLTYNSAIVNSTLKRPTLGITDFQYKIVSGNIFFLIEVTSYTTTGLTFEVMVNKKSYLTTLKMTYMALDSLFTPAFSMHRLKAVIIILTRTFISTIQGASLSTTKLILHNQPASNSFKQIKMFYFHLLII